MTIRAVLFDWGGTLAHDEHLVLGVPAEGVAAYLRERMMQPVDRATFERAFEAALDVPRGGVAPGIEQLVGFAFNWLGVPAAASDVEACSRIFFDAATRSVALYDDARALLASLRYRGYRCGIVTNEIFPGRLLQRKLNELGVTGYVDTIVSAADVGVAKPDASIYLRALSKLNVEPHEALFVGDSVETDIAGARRVNMRAVLLDRRGQRREASGYLVIHHLAALNDVLGEGALYEAPGTEEPKERPKRPR